MNSLLSTFRSEPTRKVCSSDLSSVQSDVSSSALRAFPVCTHLHENPGRTSLSARPYTKTLVALPCLRAPTLKPWSHSEVHSRAPNDALRTLNPLCALQHVIHLTTLMFTYEWKPSNAGAQTERRGEAHWNARERGKCKMEAPGGSGVRCMRARGNGGGNIQWRRT